MRASFLRHSVRIDDNSVEDVKNCPPFTPKELEEVILTGPNSILTEEYKLEFPPEGEQFSFSPQGNETGADQ